MKAGGPPMGLYSIEGFTKPPTVEDVAAKIGISPNDINREFGVILIDPKRGTYCIEARTDRVPPAYDDDAAPYRGPWSSPGIEPMDERCT